MWAGCAQMKAYAAVKSVDVAVITVHGCRAPLREITQRGTKCETSPFWSFATPYESCPRFWINVPDPSESLVVCEDLRVSRVYERPTICRGCSLWLLACQGSAVSSVGKEYSAANTLRTGVVSERTPKSADIPPGGGRGHRCQHVHVSTHSYGHDTPEVYTIWSSCMDEERMQYSVRFLLCILR